MPAVNSATLGSMPVISGISTRAPKATNSICAPASTWRPSGSSMVCDILDVLLLGAEDLVSRVAQPGHDVAVLVQSIINGGGIDNDVRVCFLDGLYPFGGGD